MIKINIGEHGRMNEDIEFNGTPDDLTADMMLQISLIYGTMKMSGHGDAADRFKRNIFGMLIDDDLKNAVFSDKLVKELNKTGAVKASVCTVKCNEKDAEKKDKKEEKEEAEKMIDDIAKSLKELLDL